MVAADDTWDQLSSISPLEAGARVAVYARAGYSGASPGCPGAALFEFFSIAGETGAEAEVFADLDADAVDDLHRELFGEPLDLLASGDAPEDLGDEEEGAAPDEIDGLDGLAPFDDTEDFAEEGVAPAESGGFDWFAPFDDTEDFAEEGAAPDADAPSEEAEAMSLCRWTR